MNSSDVEKITLTIEPEKESVRIESFADGVHSSKLIELDDLTTCFLKSVLRPTIHSGLLPQNCLSYSEGEKGWCSVTLLFPERRCDFIYHDTVYENLPLPQLAFRFSLYRGQRISGVDVGVVEDGRITPKSQMYRYPFSNVSGYRMGTGVNTLPKYDSLHGLSTLPYLIMSMPNNDDYYSAGNNRRKEEFRDLLERLRDKDPSYYYSDVLIPNGGTMEKFITLK